MPITLAPPTTGLRLRGQDAARLRRVPEADRLDPASAPPRALWAERSSHQIADGQYRLVVPCLLPAAVENGIHAALTDELRRRWVGDDRGRLWAITGVVAAFERISGRHARLTLAITASRGAALGLAGETQLDDLGMAHDLSAALAGAGLPA